MDGTDGSVDLRADNQEIVETPLFQNRSVQRDALSKSVKLKKREPSLRKQNPFEHHSFLSNTVAKACNDKRDDQIESTIEMIEKIKEMKRPRGLVLNSDMVSVSQKLDEVDFVKTKEVLGKGSGSGEVIVVKDRRTGKDLALKTIMLSQFHRDEIWAWVNLMDEKKAPELYHFALKDNKVIFTMEVMEGMTIQELVESGRLTNPEQAREISLCVLNDLLGTFESLQSKGYTHGDMHGGNVMIEPSLSLKVFDFGMTKKLLKEDINDSRRIKNDIIGIIRMFCLLYSGADFNDLDDARQKLQTDDFYEISQYMQHIPEDQRKELFSIMSMLFDSVRDQRQPEFGDTSKVASAIQEKLPQDIDTWKKKAAVIIFPEKFQPREEHDGQFEFEGETEACSNGDTDPIWDNPELEDFAENVRLEELCQLGVNLRLLDDESNI